jgi:hypothetical protein
MEIDGFLLTQEPYYVHLNVGPSTIGPFGFQDLYGDRGMFVCLSYTSEQMENLVDTPWKVARVFAILAIAFNGVSMLFLIATSCVKYHSVVYSGIATSSILGSFCIMLTFIMFASDTLSQFNPKFWLGGGMALLGFICALGTGICCLLMALQTDVKTYNLYSSASRSTKGTPPDTNVKSMVPKRNFPAPPRNSSLSSRPDQGPEAFAPGTETVTESILPDGSKKVATTRVDYDGSKTITETIVKQEAV